MIDRTFSHYRIIEKLGEGGMGVVYKAEDTRLGRPVALKFLRETTAHDREALERFQREARLISSLNHPHICSLHDVGETEGRHYLVMEYLEGQTLSARLQRKPLELAEALALALQVGDALDLAHRHGIVHRDLKPSNIMLTGPKASHAKLLDFGLAKVAGQPGSLFEQATRSDSLTGKGALMGTFQYMAPEQLEAKPVDARTDIFAFGAVLYEMVAGRKAFLGESQASLISAIMTAEPPPASSIQPVTPPALDHAIQKCLAKDPEDRWQSARDLVIELRWIAERRSETSVPAMAPVGRRARTRMLWAAVAVLSLALAASLAVIWVQRQESPAAMSPVRFSVAPPAPYTLTDPGIPALSPDGSKLAFTANPPDGPSELFVRALDSLDAKAIPETAGAIQPFWSPDGRQLGFFAGDKLKRVALAGGSPITLAGAVTGRGGTWNRDGSVLFTAAGPNVRDAMIFRVSSDGGAAMPVTHVDPERPESAHLWPLFLPDGRRFLYFVWSERENVQGIYAVTPDSGQAARVTPADANVAFVPPGFLVFRSAGRLMAQAFDVKGMRLTGEAVQIAEAVAGRLTLARFSAVPSALAYISGTREALALTWLDRKGTPLGTVGKPGEYYSPMLSPDEKTLAVGRRDISTGTRDIWLIDLVRGTQTRFTFDPSDDMNPAWSPDGRRIAFTSARKGQRDIYEKAASGIGEDQLLFGSPRDKNVESWSPDGRLLLFNSRASASGSLQIWALPLEGDRKPSAVLGGQGDFQAPQFSPDGRFVAYHSSETGRYEVYVQNFPSAGDRWLISTAGGMVPQWRADGRELFYVEGSRLMAVDVKVSGSRMEAGVPHALFQAPFWTSGRNTFVPSRDGQRFLAILRLEQPASNSITVELNWLSRLRR